jgi:hypothetical protein
VKEEATTFPSEHQHVPTFGCAAGGPIDATWFGERRPTVARRSPPGEAAVWSWAELDSSAWVTVRWADGRLGDHLREVDRPRRAGVRPGTA